MTHHSTPAIEKTIRDFREAIEGAAEVLCGPLDGFGMFGWKMEAGASPYPDQMQGDADYGEAYLRHMTSQGFNVGFAAWRQTTRTLVCLKTWEPGESEPSWPMDASTAFVSYFRA